MTMINSIARKNFYTIKMPSVVGVSSYLPIDSQRILAMVTGGTFSPLLYKKRKNSIIKEGSKMPSEGVRDRHNRLCRFFLFTVIPYALIAFSANALAGTVRIDLEALSLVESSGRNHAIGDGGKALGKFQIHSALVSDFNRFHKTQLKHADALNPVTAEKIADWALHTYFPIILRSKGIKSPTEAQILTCYNMGCGAVLKGKRATNYIKKYKRFGDRAGVSPPAITANRLKTA